jgi:thiaminase
MPFESDKVMFEIYRETEYSGRYRVVYFTELQDHNKETEINRALAGEHFYDGFIRNYRKEEAKQIIEGIVARLNEGERLGPEEVERALADHMAA